ncbi:hypothetical protein OAA18_00400 [bacterium]|nr:hypothetical protein [bacterium]
MADQTNIIPINPNTFSSEVYSPKDESLIGSSIEQNQFDTNTDYVEYFIFDLNNNKISPSGNDATFTDYTILDNEIYVNPETDVLNKDIDTGTVNSLYNFYRKWANSSPQSTYYISEISSDRTEIRLDSNLISREEIISSVSQFVSYREVDETFPDFYINLGSNILFIANNIKLDTNNTVLIKLYEPLPANVALKTSLWIVEKISTGLAYQVKFESAQLTPRTFPQLAGPNINLPIKGQLNNSTEEISLSDLSSPNSQSEYQINSYFNDPSISINVDYSDYSNFVNYSSAKNRIENFWYKVSLIESASEQITLQNTLTNNSYTSASIAPLNNLINETITNFDSYEYYLYFESSSDTYPKLPGDPPYQNESTGSLAAQNWYIAKISSSEDYDRENQNWLQYASPQFIQDDSANDQYMTFLNMIGHFVDNDIWIYLKDTTNKWDADNRINAGVSKDLVAQVLRDMGVKLYQNNFSSTDLYSAFLGFTDSGSLFPFPYMTGSLPTPSGYEYISNFISSSDEAIPLDDINKRIYKRIYHNLPYLLKSKGTVAGLRTLITSYGIPDTILRISEFGGKDKINVNDWDLWKHQYNYQYNTLETGYITSSWNQNTDWSTPNPQTVQFRFKVPKSGSNAVDNPLTYNNQQVLWSLNSNPQIAIGLDYYGDGFTSGSWSGSVPSESLEYANLAFTTDGFGTTSSIYLPFFDGEWWSVMLTKEDANFTLYAGNKIYNGNDGSQIGFIESASVIIGSTDWDGATKSFFPSDRRLPIPPYQPFSGSYQEIRYFDQAISESVFKDYVMNPQSSEGNGINGSANQLSFRAPLGGELYTGSVSVHPKVSYQTPLPSFIDGTSNFSVENPEDFTFTSNREWVFYDSPPVGIKNRNTDKIKRQDLILPPGNTYNTGSLGVNALSNQKSIQQKSYTTQDYTNNLNLLEVAFSPQNQINDDIISQIGYFNVGDYIGDPRLVSSSADTYPSLVELSKQYFEKYTSSYDVYDYIRLIKFFDNSLFKMIKDFVPSRTGLASGIVVKQHILERQKYPTPQAAWTRPEYTGSIGSTPALLDGARYYEASTDFESNPIVTVEGGAGGSVNEFNVPVGYFRAVDTLSSSELININSKTLFALGTLAMGAIGANGINIIQNGQIDGNGKFTINSDYTFKGDVNIEVKNTGTQRTMVLELVEDTDGVVNSIQKVVPVTSGATYTSLTLTNCVFKPGKTYYFQLKTTSSSTTINGVTRVNFVQQDAPLTFRSGQMYSEVIKTPLGDVTETISNSHEFYDGEFSGSAVLVTDGELNTECDDIKKADTSNITFDIEFSSFNPDGTLKLPNVQLPFTGPPPSFTNTAQTLPSGDLNVYFTSTRVTVDNGASGKFYTDTFKVEYIAISKTSKNGVDLEPSIPNATELTILTSTLVPTIDQTYNSGLAFVSLTTSTSTLKFNVVSIKEYANSYLIEVTSDASIVLVSRKLPGAYVGDAEPYPVLVTTQNDTLSVLNPYIEGNFANSDCNPLNNNATDITPSTVYYDVDYANNPNVAVNFGAIMSGSAPKAKIQDYNYHARRSTIPRYEGSKNTSNTYNVEDGAINATQALFGYFNWVGGTSPEWGNGLEDRSVANLRFLLDVNGKIIKPIADSKGINQGIVENNFTEGKIATLAFDDETGSSAAFSNLLGNHTIFKSGKDIVPIIYSQTASISSTNTGGYTGSLTFVQGDQAESSVDDYRLSVFAQNQIILNTGTVTFQSPTVEGTEASFSSNVYAPTSSPSTQSPQTTLNFKVFIEKQFTADAQATFRLQKNSNGAGWVNFGPSTTLDANIDDSITIQTSDATALLTDDYRLQITSQNDAGQGNLLEIKSTSYLRVSQTPPPSIGAVGPDTPGGTNYWTKLGVTTNQFRTNALTAVLGQRQQDISGSGFFGITNDFEIQVGDEIRFQGTETQTYKITAIDVATNPSYPGALVYTVDRNITLTNTEMNWFLVRRYVDNPANIILEVDKPAGGTSPGILKPQYLSKDAEDNIDTILENLRRDSLI